MISIGKRGARILSSRTGSALQPHPPFAWAGVPFEQPAAGLLLAELTRDPAALIGDAIAAELGGLLSERLQRCRAVEQVPESGAPALRREYQRTLAQNVVFLAELDAVLDALAAEGIQVLLLKGAALLTLGVFTAAERPMSDLDLLVADADISSVETALSRLGYRLETTRSAAYETRYAGQRAFLRETPAGPCWIDLHRDLFAVDWLRGEGGAYRAGCWRRSRPLADRLTARVLDPADQAVHICLHWLLHHGLGGVWPAVDLAATVGQAGFTWERLAQRARESGWPAAVFLALRRATTLTGFAVPAPVLSSLVPAAVRRVVLDHLLTVDASVLPRTSAAQATRFLHLAACEPGPAFRLIGRAIWPEWEWLALRYDGRDPSDRLDGVAMAGVARRLWYWIRLARLLRCGLGQLTAPRRPSILPLKPGWRQP